MILYQCDYILIKWIKNCIRQVDCILVVGFFEGDLVVSEVYLGILVDRKFIRDVDSY